jgi:hypothetical protein
MISNKSAVNRDSILKNTHKTECRQQHTRRRPDVMHRRTSTRRRSEGWRAGQFLTHFAVSAAPFALFRDSIGRIPAGDSTTANQMPFVGCVLFLALAATLSASSIGIVVGSTCEAGTCPPSALAFGSSETLPVDFTITLPDSDTYSIDGSFTDTINSTGSRFSLDYPFQITYEGNATGGSSAADTVTVLADYAFQAAYSTASATSDLIGAFGPTIAASSSASDCVNGAHCLGPTEPPGSFDLTNNFSLSATGDEFIWDFALTSDFGAGSPVGSYIVWGQTTSITSPTPEPAYLGLLAVGFGGIVIARRRLRGLNNFVE